MITVLTEFLFASLGPWFAKKILNPETLLQLGYDIVEEIWQVRNPGKPLPKFMTDFRDALGLK